MNTILFCQRISLRLYVINTKQIDCITFLQIAGVPATHAAVTDDNTVSFGRYLNHSKISFLVTERVILRHLYS